MTGVYADFFATNPITYYSHINFISLFVAYPYTMSIGELIGSDALGFAGLNANANFWATDGIAALGIPGIIIIGAIIGFCLLVANSIIAPSERRLSFLAVVPFIMSVTNASFFTGVLTGGGGLLLLLIYLWQEAKRHEKRVSAALRQSGRTSGSS